MRIWDILKEENAGKSYSSGHDVYEVRKTGDGVYLYKNGNSLMIGSWVLDKDFKEIKNEFSWVTDIKHEELYYTIDETGDVENYYYDERSSLDIKCKNVHNMFSTKEKAEEVANEQLLYRMIKKFRDINDSKILDWSDYKLGFFIAFDTENQEYFVECSKDYRRLHTIYFSTRELAERCLYEVVLPFFEYNEIFF